MIIVLSATGLIAVRTHQSETNVSAVSGEPEYPTILPSGKSANELGGWQRISPPGKDPVFAYADTLSGVSISVSEQPLPASFKGNVEDAVAKLAEKFSATTKLEAGDVTIYVGTSVKGPQSALFAKGDLLVMIKSQKKINDAAWKTYVASLR